MFGPKFVAVFFVRAATRIKVRMEILLPATSSSIKTTKIGIPEMKK